MPSYTYTHSNGTKITLTVSASLDNTPTFPIGRPFTISVRAENISGATVNYNQARIDLVVAGTSYEFARFTMRSSGSAATGSGSGTISATHCKGNDISGELLRSYFKVSVSYNGSGIFHNFSGNAFYIEDTTTAPAFSLDESMFGDPSGIKGRFGSFVQSNSAFAFALPIDGIEIGNDVTGSGRVSSTKIVVSDAEGNVLFSKSKSVSATATHIEFDAESIFTAYGDCKADVSVTGLYGKTNTLSTVIHVAQYNPPQLAQNGANEIAKRFRLETGDSGNIYIDSPEGESVLMAFSGYIQPFSGLNTYTLTARYGEENAETMESAAIATGTDADVLVFDYENTAGILPNTFNVKNSYRIEVVLVDWFGKQATLAAYVEKATPDYTHNPNGFSVGMYSTAAPEEPKFEVAETHESHFYGGIAGVTNYPAVGVEELTGGKWINGDPIYRQVLQYTLNTTGSTVSALTIEGFNELVSMTGRFYRSADGFYHQLNFYASSSDMNYAYMRSDGVLRLRSTDKAVVTAIVEYTKK